MTVVISEFGLSPTQIFPTREMALMVVVHLARAFRLTGDEITGEVNAQLIREDAQSQGKN